MKRMNFIWTTLPLALVLGLATAISAQDTATLTATENGVGPINKTTPFNVKKIRALLPALQVKQAIGASESEEFPILKVYDQGQLLLVIYPDETQRKIFSIDIASNRVQTPNGVKRGVLFSQIYPTGRPKDCTPGLEQETGQVFCPAPNSKHFLYVFTGKEFPEGDGLPSLKILRRGKLKSIVWKP